MFAGDAADFADGLDRAEDVAGVRQGDEARFGRDGPAEVVGLNVAVGVGLETGQGNAAVLLQARSGRLTLLCSRSVVTT